VDNPTPQKKPGDKTYKLTIASEGIQVEAIKGPFPWQSVLIIAITLVLIGVTLVWPRKKTKT